MRIIPDEREILKGEVVDISHGGIDLHAWQRARRARELQPRLFEMIAIQMQIATRMDKRTRLEPRDLCDHHGE